jgi:WD40 repeat protein
LVWDMVTGQRLYELQGHTDFVDSVKFSPDGGRLITASKDEIARIWDLSNHRQILSLPVGRSGNVAIAFSPDGKRLAATGEADTISIWDAANGKQVLTLEGHTAPVVQIAFSPAGTQLATSSENTEDGIKVWNVMTGKELFSLKEDHPMFGLAFSPDGKRLAAVGAGRTAVVWDVAAGKKVLPLLGHSRAVYSVAFTPDGSRLATASGDGMVKIWDANRGIIYFVRTQRRRLERSDQPRWQGVGNRQRRRNVTCLSAKPGRFGEARPLAFDSLTHNRGMPEIFAYGCLSGRALA